MDGKAGPQVKKAEPSAAASTAGNPPEEEEEEKLEGLQNLFSDSKVIPHSELPARFKDPSRQKYTRKKQMAMYRTSSNDYGLRPHSKEESVEQYHGLNGRFTTAFANNMFRYDGLETTTAKHKVKKPAEFGVN